MSKILDYLYVGSFNDANNNDYLIDNNITTIINLTDKISLRNDKLINIKYYQLPLLDSPTQPILNAILITNKIIDDNKNNGNILIHC